MSDVRALLKAKRQEARVNHPYAAYSATGQLRCLVCGTTIKHASAWEGHVGSKSHRMNVTRSKEEEQGRSARMEESEIHVKRKADENPSVPEQSLVELKKRRIEGSSSPLQTPAKTDNGFPRDFFSNPSHAPPPDSDEEDGDSHDGRTVPEPTTSEPTPGQNAVDLEWRRFQQAVLSPPDEQETYERATVFAEPVLSLSEVVEGFPASLGEEPALVPEELTEEQKHRKKEREERELIMDRLLEEERAQEEADAKVAMLKNRLEALRKHREAQRAAKKG